MFRDYDPLRTDLITASQFASGLGMVKWQVRERVLFSLTALPTEVLRQSLYFLLF